MFNNLKTTACASLALLAGCATPSTSDISKIAKPDVPPTASTTRFDGALSCMDKAFQDFGVSDVTIAVSAVPDYTGQVFVGSDIWLQTAITKMSQRSGAFTVTDYNPNQLAPEQGLWTLSQKEGFYIPAYYIRGAISGFANNVAENSASLGASDPTNSGALVSGSAYSLVSVDLSIGNLQQRTLINRARAANEVALRSRASGGQLGGVLSSFGANLEIVANRSDGIPQAVRALIELNAIESLGRLTGVPYWSCLGTSHDDGAARNTRADIYYSMTESERIVFAQRRLSRLGYFKGEINGTITPGLQSAIEQYSKTKGQSPLNGLALYEALTNWSESNRGGRAVAPLRTAAEPVRATQPVPKNVSALSNGMNVQINLSAASHRSGAPLSFALQSSKTAYAYCYMQDIAGDVSRVFPNRWQPDPAITSDKRLSVPGPNARFDLVFPPAGAREQVTCFVSSAALGETLPGELKGEDLTPLPVRSLSDLRSQFERSATQQKSSLAVRELDIIGQ